ncbi:hypothetical protein SBC1_69460 (plasmid) [Caballeronia sp. SBC1]|nr:hypothetical protein SBC2_69200 [Caballeronia sp. SBC2]QIN66899.1 hypothetical protein SBC1_69460 [Caballeronia sp. SBC1]
MLRPWLHAKGLFKRLQMLAIKAPELHVLGDSGWSFRETLPRHCLVREQGDGPRLSSRRTRAARTGRRIKI